MPCPALSTPFGRRVVTGATFTQVGGSNAELATWRCLEIAASAPARVRLAWHATADVSDPQITFDVGRAVRVYFLSDRYQVDAYGIGGADTEVQFMVSDVPGPLPCVLQQSAVLAVGTYDSASDEEVRPPWFAARLLADASSGAAAACTLYSGATAVAVVSTAAWPAGGVPLAGITRITATVTTGPARLVWLLEL